MSSVFISYSRRDSESRRHLEDHLKGFEGIRSQIWTDAKIEPGADWRPRIVDEIQKSKIVVALVSSSFLASEFITQVEVPNFLRARQQNGTIIAPLILRPCAWQQTKWIECLQVYPVGGRPLLSMNETERELALLDFGKWIDTKIARKHESSGDPSIIDLNKSPGSFAFRVRGQIVLTDEQLSEFFQRPVKHLNQARERNPDRFDEDYAFQLNHNEWKILNDFRSKQKPGRGGRRTPPWVYTEKGAAMMATVLRTPRAVEASKLIVETFVEARRNAKPVPPGNSDGLGDPDLSNGDKEAFKTRLGSFGTDRT